MENVDSPKGFGLLYGSERYVFQPYDVDSSNGGTIALGDSVTQEADGNVTRSSAGDANSVVGVVVSCYNSNGAVLRYIPASTAGSVLVALALPGAKFIVQDDASAALTTAAIGATADHVDAAADTYRAISQQELDASNVGVGTQMRIVDVLDTPNNSAGNNADWIVTFVESAWINAASI